MRRLVSCAVIAVLWPAGMAGAQAAVDGRVLASINAGYHSRPTDFRDTLAFTTYLENWQLESRYGLDPAVHADGALTVRLWHGVAAGVAVSRFSGTGEAAVSGRVPHPFHFQQGRELTGQAPGLRREEAVVHLHGAFIVPVGKRMLVALFGGPSFFSIRQRVVRGVHYAEAFPFDDVTFERVDAEPRTASATGFHAGADVGYFFSRRLGIGGVIRLTRATVDLPAGDTRVRVDAGGVQAGAGLRLRF